MKGRSDRTGKEITSPWFQHWSSQQGVQVLWALPAFWGHLFTGKVSLFSVQVSHFSFKCKCSPFPWILLEMAQRALRVFDHLAPLLVFPTLPFHSCACVVLCSVLSMDSKWKCCPISSQPPSPALRVWDMAVHSFLAPQISTLTPANLDAKYLALTC